MDIIVHDPGRYHVSLDTVWEFEQAIQLESDVRVVSSRESSLARLPNLVWRAYFRGKKALPPAFTLWLFGAAELPDTFSVMMGPNFRKAVPRLFAPGRKSVYMFDAWPRNHERIRRFAEACALDHLFVSSSQAAAALSLKCGTTRCHWVPEGITPGDYFLAFRPEKDIDVLQLGRRYNKYHEMIAPTLERSGKKYFYERVAGKVIFPTRLDYVEGLARTKISICAPMSVSHPERAGGIETMTVRYLQSMLSRCLVVGHAPSEMVQIFGYNPVIEIDYSNPANQLLDLLKNLGDYAPLIEKNYRAVREHHTWINRWRQILDIMGVKPAPPQPDEIGVGEKSGAF
jgi:hypothetical protein